MNKSTIRLTFLPARRFGRPRYCEDVYSRQTAYEEDEEYSCRHGEFVSEDTPKLEAENAARETPPSA